MKVIATFFFIVLFVESCKQKNTNTDWEKNSKDQIGQLLDPVVRDLDSLHFYVKNKNQNQTIAFFKKSRNRFKACEGILEYYFQGITERINGPALPDIDTDNNQVYPPRGFQVIEQQIFGEPQASEKNISMEIKFLQNELLFCKNQFKELPMQPFHLYELIQHQIIRIAVQGITGFDSSVAFQSLSEADAALDGLKKQIFLLSKHSDFDKNQKITCIKNLSNAQTYLKSNPHFDSFDRLEFIKKHLMPLSLYIEKAANKIITNNREIPKVFDGTLTDLMQGRKLHPEHFTPYGSASESKRKLGEKLFFEPRLSKNGTMSCATCHQPNQAFTDGKRFSGKKIHGDAVNQRNTPTLLYSAMQNAFFYDFRAASLENQIDQVIQNPNEFNWTAESIKKFVLSNQEYQNLVREAYPDNKEITHFEVRHAIASYVRNLMPFSSKIDKYFKGETELDSAEKNGFNLFAGKAKCATCHFIPLYSGTVPPKFDNTESEVLAVPQNPVWKNASVDPDLGRYNINPVDEYRYAFKTPTIRNSSKTAPYMHNGVYNRLEQVIEFYEKGGGKNIGAALNHQTLPFDKLQLNAKEKKDLLLFLKALDD